MSTESKYDIMIDAMDRMHNTYVEWIQMFLLDLEALKKIRDIADQTIRKLEKEEP